MLILSRGAVAFAALKQAHFPAQAFRLLDFPFMKLPEAYIHRIQVCTSAIQRDTEMGLAMPWKRPIGCPRKEEESEKLKLEWEEKFALLRAFRKEHGHCRVPPGYTVAGFNMGGWVATQRKEYSKFCHGSYSAIINEKRVMRLEQVGFEWSKALNRIPTRSWKKSSLLQHILQFTQWGKASPLALTSS